MDELSAYQRIFAKKNRAATAPIMPYLGAQAALARLESILPHQKLCDGMVSSYVYNGEKSLRVVHIPTLFSLHQRFWERREEVLSEYPGFIPLLWAVMLVGSSWDRAAHLERNLAEQGLTKVAVCKLIEAWLKGQGWKRRTELIMLRIQTLMLMANQLCLTYPLETIWNSSAELVRSAMTMGLHRDPSEFPEISIFEGEQRRKLWHTIVELDLQGSLISGCPGLVRDTDYTTQPPANVDDLQLFEEMFEHPVSRPIEEWTDSSCQSVLARSMKLRLQAMNLAFNVTTEPDYKAFLEVGGKLESLLRNLPPIVKFDFSSSLGPEGPGRLIGRLLLDLFIRRLCVCLYRPFVLASGEDETFIEGRKACLRTSMMILCRQDSFDPNSVDLTVITSEKYWDVYNILLRTDILQAAFSVCLEIKAMGEIPQRNAESQQQYSYPPQQQLPTPSSYTQSPYTNIPSPSSPWAVKPSFNHPSPNNPSTTSGSAAITSTPFPRSSLIRAVENALASLLRRIGETGTDLRDPLALAMVLEPAKRARTGIVQGQGQRETDEACRVGVERVREACRAWGAREGLQLAHRDQNQQYHQQYQQQQQQQQAGAGAGGGWTTTPGARGEMPLQTPPVGADEVGYHMPRVEVVDVPPGSGWRDFELGIDWDWGETWA
jgi:hypothetical protein